MTTLRRLAEAVDGVVAVAVVLGAGFAGLGYLLGRWLVRSIDDAMRRVA